MDNLEKLKSNINSILNKGNKLPIKGFTKVPTDDIKELINYLKTLENKNFSLNIDLDSLKTHEKQFLFCLNNLFYIRNKVEVENFNASNGVDPGRIYKKNTFNEANFNKCEPNNTMDSFERAKDILKFLNNGTTKKDIFKNLLIFNCYFNLVYSGILHHKTILFNPDFDSEKNIYTLKNEDYKIVIIDPISIYLAKIYIILGFEEENFNTVFETEINKFISVCIKNKQLPGFENYYMNFFLRETKYFKYIYNINGLIYFIQMIQKIVTRYIDKITRDFPKCIFPLIRNRLHTDFHGFLEIVIKYNDTIYNE